MVTTPPDKSPDPITGGKSMEPIEKPMTPPSTAGFDTYMQKTPGSPKQAGPGSGSQGPTPIDLSKTPTFQTAGPTFNTLLAQAKTAQDSLGTVKDQLNTPNLKFKRSQSHLMKNKLSDANSYIRSAGAKLGIEAPAMKMPSGATPLDRFLMYVNDGQDQLLSVQQKLKELSASREDIRPGDMMYLQVKMGLAQQEIEYSSTLLSKVISSITTIMNTQL